MEHDTIGHSYKGRDAAFTLVELMIVIAVLGILASIAIPQFADLMRKSREGSTKGNLGTLRSAISIYGGDMDGQFPEDPTSMTINSKYLSQFPTAMTPDYHPDNTGIDYASFDANNDGGGWQYQQIYTAPNFGMFWVNCGHTDSRGTIWSAY